MSGTLRPKEIRTRRARKAKLHKLRERYESAKTDDERTKILEKVGRIAMWLSQDEFLAPLNAKK